MNKKELMRVLGDNLQEVRTQRGFTQERLAEKIGISTSFYANIERGVKGVSLYVLKQIADELEVSIDYLLTNKHMNSKISNIYLLLGDVPESFIEFIEKVIRISKEEFYRNN